jgi:receptor protein-tyrosine kinase
VSIIEQAAKRLEELRRSGMEVPRPGAAPAAPAQPASNDAAPAPAPLSSRLVEFDLARLEREGYIVPSGPRTRLADEFRTIKRPLLANIRGESAAPIRRANCIMITSSVPGEGKTFSAVNLALSLAAEIDSRVLLIDCDVIRPMVMQRLGLPAENRGLLDKLNDPKLALNDLILRTNIEKLSLLPAGRADLRATELLASDAMRAIVDELASRYADRIIIFDTPPLLAAPETRVLASLVGQIVVVVEAHRTRQRTLSEALAQLQSCSVVMMMLNKTTGPVQAAYGYPYGYSSHA